MTTRREDDDPMAKPDVVTWGSDRLLITPWQGSHDVHVVTPVPGRAPSADAVGRVVDLLVGRGARFVLTGALTPDEEPAFADHGFTIRERLSLLRHDLRSIPDDPRWRTRRAWRRDHERVLAVDAAAFEPFWHFDAVALREARAATPSSQFRVVDEGGIRGYAIAGRATRTAYLQRLAVHPSHQGTGVGRALAIDALRWARQRRADEVLVNTQVANAAALALYDGLGFTPGPTGLVVLECSLNGSPLDAGHPSDDRGTVPP